MNTLDATYRDKLNLKGNCPGFRLWDVLASDGVRYVMASDSAEGVGTRLHFRSRGRIAPVSVTLIGDNPDAAEWDKARGL